MKKIILLTFFALLIYTESHSQDDNSYAIVRVERSKNMIASYNIDIYYGNDSITEFYIANKKKL